MSTEINKSNIRGLIQDCSEYLDIRMAELREGTPLGDVRPADAKTFMLVSRHPRSASELARSLGISRQAAHLSLNRLMELGVVELETRDGNQRDKIAVVTKQGNRYKKLIAEKIAIIESEIESVVGKRDLEDLRRILSKFLSHRE